MVDNIKKREGISPRAMSTLETSKRSHTNDTSRLQIKSREECIKPFSSLKAKRKSYIPDIKGGSLFDDAKN
jgi:hypothetical protein